MIDFIGAEWHKFVSMDNLDLFDNVSVDMSFIIHNW